MANATQYQYMTVQIGTVDFTGYLANVEQIASLPVNGEVGRAMLTFRNDGSLPAIPKWGTVVISAGTAAPGTPVWGGYATRKTYEPVGMHGGTAHTVTVDCQSFAIGLVTTEPITETFGGGYFESLVLDNDIVDTLVQTYLPAFYNAGSISSVNQVQCDYIQFSEETLRSALNKIVERSGKEYGISGGGEFFYRPPSAMGTLDHQLTDEPDFSASWPMQSKPFYDEDSVELRNAIRVVGGWTLSAAQTEDFTTDGVAYQFQVDYFPQEIINITLANIPQSVGYYLVDDPADFDVLVWYDQRKFIYQLPPSSDKTLRIVYRYPVQVKEDVINAASVTAIGGTIWGQTIQDSSISDATVAQIAGSAYLARGTASVERGQLMTTYVGTATPYLPGQIVKVSAQAFGWNENELEIQAVTMRFSPRPADGVGREWRKPTSGPMLLLMSSFIEEGSCLTYWDLDVGTPISVGRSFGEAYSNDPNALRPKNYGPSIFV